jgi:hypothetical protein
MVPFKIGTPVTLQQTAVTTSWFNRWENKRPPEAAKRGGKKKKGIKRNNICLKTKSLKQMERINMFLFAL